MNKSNKLLYECYIFQCTDELMRPPFVEEMNKIPIPKDLSTQYDWPSKEEVVARHVSRFSQGEVGSQHTVQPDQELLAYLADNT